VPVVRIEGPNTLEGLAASEVSPRSGSGQEAASYVASARSLHRATLVPDRRGRRTPTTARPLPFRPHAGDSLLMLLHGVVRVGMQAQATDASWTEVVRAVAPAATAVLALVGGIFAYFKFVRGRIFHPRCWVDLKSTTVRIDGKQALHVEAHIRNDGQSALRLDAEFSQRLDVFIADGPVWKDAASSDGAVLWHAGGPPHRSLDILFDAGLITYAVPRFRDPALAAYADPAPLDFILEPGEEAKRCLLVPVSQAYAYLCQLTIQACPHVGWANATRHRRCTQRKEMPNRWQARVIAIAKDSP
jgi:hypothetical protein